MRGGVDAAQLENSARFFAKPSTLSYSHPFHRGSGKYSDDLRTEGLPLHVVCPAPKRLGPQSIPSSNDY